ncbi:MAG: MFS transporter [Brevundimonas sp.]|uniref:MFS transporter n=1 Tax=Brevundimonas sp. TaxID=1871086 RepID=UPI002488427E|nr:MFS transporter [Brevundimonas sp.]MDI1328499.1 MFS transporter [Brevundimonas sp.]
MLQRIRNSRIVSGTTETSISRGVFVLIFVVSMAMAVGNTGLISVMPAIGRAIGISDHLVAAIFSLSALLWALSAPHWAKVSDVRGRKPMMMLGLGGFVFSMLGCALVVWAGLQALLTPLAVFAAFAVIRGIFGLLGSATASSSQAYVADRTSEKDRTAAMSALAGALGMGTIIGPAVSPLLVFGFLGLAGPMTIFALIAGGILVAVAVVIPRDRPPVLMRSAQDVSRDGQGSGTSPRLWSDRNVAPYLLYGLLSGCAQAINVYTLGFVIMDSMALPLAQSQAYIGIAMAAGAVAGLVGQWVLIPLLKLSPRQLLRSGALLALAGNLITVFAHDFWLLTLGYVVLTLGFGFCRPGFMAGASLAAREDQQGGVAGMVSSVSGAAIVVTPVIGVLLYEFAPAAPFILNCAVMAGLARYAWKNASLRRGKPGLACPPIVS